MPLVSSAAATLKRNSRVFANPNLRRTVSRVAPSAIAGRCRESLAFGYSRTLRAARLANDVDRG